MYMCNTHNTYVYTYMSSTQHHIYTHVYVGSFDGIPSVPYILSKPKSRA